MPGTTHPVPFWTSRTKPSKEIHPQGLKRGLTHLSRQILCLGRCAVDKQWRPGKTYRRAVVPDGQGVGLRSISDEKPFKPSRFAHDQSGHRSLPKTFETLSLNHDLYGRARHSCCGQLDCSRPFRCVILETKIHLIAIDGAGKAVRAQDNRGSSIHPHLN